MYGAVVTGPTKEILKLKEDPEVSAIRIGEVALWNWRE
ncbi:anti sigma factor C-terminal domain-containing protein [Paenibacillus sp. USDA918EY]